MDKTGYGAASVGMVSLARHERYATERRYSESMNIVVNTLLRARTVFLMKSR